MLPPIIIDYVQKFIDLAMRNRFIKMITENYLELAKQYYKHNARILQEKPDSPFGYHKLNAQ